MWPGDGLKVSACGGLGRHGHRWYGIPTRKGGRSLREVGPQGFVSSVPGTTNIFRICWLNNVGPRRVRSMNTKKGAGPSTRNDKSGSTILQSVRKLLGDAAPEMSISDMARFGRLLDDARARGTVDPVIVWETPTSAKDVDASRVLSTAIVLTVLSASVDREALQRARDMGLGCCVLRLHTTQRTIVFGFPIVVEVTK